MADLIEAPAGFAPLHALAFGGVGTAAVPVSSATPLPVGAAALPMTGTSVTLTAGQAAGTDVLIPANAARRSLMFSAPADFRVALAASQTTGMPIYGTARDALVGQECPTNALYLVAGSGLTAGNVLLYWEA